MAAGLGENEEMGRELEELESSFWEELPDLSVLSWASVERKGILLRCPKTQM